jgi:uncharacterized protein (UPF0335 family)
MTVVLHGSVAPSAPQLEALRQVHGCARVIGNWSPLGKGIVLPNTLLITDRDPDVIRRRVPKAKIIPIEQALRELHNEPDTEPAKPSAHAEVAHSTSSGNVAADQLRLFIERVERIEEEKKGMQDDIKDVYLEAKSQGYDPKTMRAIVRLRKIDPNDRLEGEALLETYKAALGLG